MTRPRRKKGAPPTTGTELQRDLLVAAKDAGWRVQMSRRSQMCRTESTSGFPDLMLAKPGKMLFIECKSRYEKLAPEQEDWAYALMGWPAGQYPDQISIGRYAGPEGVLDVAWMVARPSELDVALAWIREEERTWQ